ncbi:hypothetical protein LTR81_009189 [Elasticomyces elasticus]
MASFSSSWASLSVLILVAVVLAIRPIIHGLTSPLNKVPGPWYARWTNLPLKFAVISGRRIHHVHALHARYGPYVRIAPTEIAVNSLAGFKQIHAINSGFTKSPWYETLVNIERLGVFSMSDPKQHAARRKLFARPFSKTNLRSHWEPAVREKVQLAVSRMQEDARSSGSGAVDVMKWWTFMASDITSHLMFGESLHTLEHGEVSEYMRVLMQTLKGGGIGAEMPLVRWIGRNLPFQSARELFGGNDMVEEYGRTAVSNMKASGSGKNVFANMVAEAEKDIGGTLDDRDVELEATSFVIAGTDTTAVSLTYLVYAVLSRPDLRRQVEDEVAGLPEAYVEADVEKLPLLSAVIEETLRVYGAGPGMLPRMVPAGGKEMGGYVLPGGTTTTTQSYSLHRDADLFPDPDWCGSMSSTAEFTLTDLTQLPTLPLASTLSREREILHHRRRQGSLFALRCRKP